MLSAFVISFVLALNVVVETKKGQMRYFHKQDPTRKVSSFLTEEFDHDISEIYVDRLNQISFADDEIIGTAESQSQTQLIYLLGPGMSTLNSCWEQDVSCNRLEISDFILNKYSNYLEWISRGFEMYSAVTFPVYLDFKNLFVSNFLQFSVTFKVRQSHHSTHDGPS